MCRYRADVQGDHSIGGPGGIYVLRLPLRFLDSKRYPGVGVTGHTLLEGL